MAKVREALALLGEDSQTCRVFPKKMDGLSCGSLAYEYAQGSRKVMAKDEQDFRRTIA